MEFSYSWEHIGNRIFFLNPHALRTKVLAYSKCDGSQNVIEKMIHFSSLINFPDGNLFFLINLPEGDVFFLTFIPWFDYISQNISLLFHLLLFIYLLDLAAPMISFNCLGSGCFGLLVQYHSPVNIHKINPRPVCWVCLRSTDRVVFSKTEVKSICCWFHGAFWNNVLA